MRSDFDNWDDVGDLLGAVWKVVDEFFNVRDVLAMPWILEAKTYIGKCSKCILFLRFNALTG